MKFFVDTADVAEIRGIRQLADTEGIADDDDGAFHGSNHTGAGMKAEG